MAASFSISSGLPNVATPTKSEVRCSRPNGSSWKLEFCQTPHMAIGCSACSMRLRTPPTHMVRSM